jgi:hypothetical protein
MIKEAISRLDREFVRATYEGEGNIPEADDGVNNASRNLITAFAHDYGTCWLGHTNIHPRHHAVMWEHNEASHFVYNFGADFVVPAYDQVLYDLIMERKNAAYTGVHDDIPRLAAIHNRIYELGGQNLLWG